MGRERPASAMQGGVCRQAECSLLLHTLWLLQCGCRQALVAKRVAHAQHLVGQAGALAARPLRLDGDGAHRVAEAAHRLGQLQRRRRVSRACCPCSVQRRLDPERAHHAPVVAGDGVQERRAALRLRHLAHVRVGRADQLLEPLDRARRVDAVEQRRVHRRALVDEGVVEAPLLIAPPVQHLLRRGVGRRVRLAQPRRERRLEGAKAALEVGGGGHAVLRVLHRLVVLLEEEEEAELARRVGLERLADGDEVLEALRHLEPVDGQVARVPKVVARLAAVVVRLDLRHLVLVVRELEVDPARVDVHLAAQQVGHHRRALDVPPRPPLPPRGRPRRLARLGRLPERKVGGVPLVCLGTRGGEGALPLGEELLVRQRRGVDELAVHLALRRGEGGRVKVDGAVCLVAVPVPRNRLDVRDDLGNVVGDARHRVGRTHVERRHVLEEGRLLLEGQLHKRRLHVAHRRRRGHAGGGGGVAQRGLRSDQLQKRRLGRRQRRLRRLHRLAQRRCPGRLRRLRRRLRSGV
mmetsp:Transcript_25848/g.74788  ORF Transcript_25848/g.74788 Transcript_25848/m.74788 type:complete len:521 (-) Transcript_25848:1687-3249(-)